MTKAYPYIQSGRLDVVGFLPDITKKTKILEIGCGTGQFRESIPGCSQYWGIEPAESVAQKAVTVLDKVLIGTFDQVYDALPDNFFDCVVCNDVIEHMPDENVFLQKIKAKMTKNGVIVGSVPNVRFLDNLFRLLVLKDWKYVETGVLDRTHIRFFTQKSLQRAFLSNGYEIEAISGINSIRLKSPVDGYKFKRLVLRLLGLVVAVFIGSDSKFAQFGFRVKPHR